MAADAITAAMSRYMITELSWMMKSMKSEMRGGFSSSFGPSSSRRFAASAGDRPFSASDWNSAMMSSMDFSWIFSGALTLTSSVRSTAEPRLFTEEDMSLAQALPADPQRSRLACFCRRRRWPGADARRCRRPRGVRRREGSSLRALDRGHESALAWRRLRRRAARSDAPADTADFDVGRGDKGSRED